ncbi:MAG TPA: glycosyl hydrolase family 39 [Verrucomicrobiae bacterium]|nr:glycosyl hydrolase family 39 [Verrucomicrobiae bacterium]
MVATILRTAALTCAGIAVAAAPPATVNVNWDTIVRVSNTTPSLQVVVNPPLRRGSAIHDRVFQAFRELQADYARYVPWLPYPRLAVAELAPPRDGVTSWDFSLIDPMTIDLLEAVKGRPVVLNFSTTPQWMWVTRDPVTFPSDPEEPVWNYSQGTELRDPSGNELAGYYARLVGWYTRGGFVDEFGKRHESGHHYKIDWWEVLNEPDLEHRISPELYTRVYDAIVEAIGGVAPEMKFVGVSLAGPSGHPEMFEYFLDPRNHKAGIPLDAISYHFYASPRKDESPEIQEHTFWAQADGFLNTVRYIEAIRKRLSPSTRTTINEVGAISADDGEQNQPGHVTKPIPASYWNLCGALYAYLFGELSRMGIDVVNASQLVGYPTQYPSVSMVDWESGQPNARFWVLKLLRDSFAPGDKLVRTVQPGQTLYAQAFLVRDNKRRLLLVNKRDREIEVTIPQAAGGTIHYVDRTTGSQPASSAQLSGDLVKLGGFSVAVVELPPAQQ